MNHWNQKRKRPNPQSVEEKQEFLRKKEESAGISAVLEVSSSERKNAEN